MVKSDISKLGKWSKQMIDLVCDDCSVEKSIKYKLYTSYGYENGEYYCRKCKLRRNNLEKWGVENVFQSDIIKEKIRETNLEKWGVENPSQNKDIKEKIRESISKLDKLEINKKREVTNLKKWGVKNISQLKEVKEKKIETSLVNIGSDYLINTDYFRNYMKENNLKKYGDEYYFKTVDFKKKSEKSNKEKWGVKNPSQNKEVKEKIRKSVIQKLHSNILKYNVDNIVYINSDTFDILCSYCNKQFSINKILFYKRRETKTTICTICNPVDKHQSGKEISLLNFIKSIYDGEIIQSYRDGLEIDIYLPELKIGFEFNGVWWHSDVYKDKWYHLDKTRFFSESDIRIIHIWEDDWDNKRNIIESQIKNWLGLSNRIWARSCKVREVSIRESMEFLEKNHIQGSIGSSLKIGLYLQDELISLMTFDNLEGRKRMTLGNWNINRFCNKIDFSIIGGASKIFNYFIKNYDINRVISYADRDWSQGKLYENLGFNRIVDGKPDYKYVVDGFRIHKSKFKKSKTGLSESSLDIPKIWDCGKIKYEIIIERNTSYLINTE